MYGRPPYGYVPHDGAIIRSPNPGAAHAAWPRWPSNNHAASRSTGPNRSLAGAQHAKAPATASAPRRRSQGLRPRLWQLQAASYPGDLPPQRVEPYHSSALLILLRGPHLQVPGLASRRTHLWVLRGHVGHEGAQADAVCVAVQRTEGGAAEERWEGGGRGQGSGAGRGTGAALKGFCDEVERFRTSNYWDRDRSGSVACVAPFAFVRLLPRLGGPCPCNLNMARLSGARQPYDIVCTALPQSARCAPQRVSTAARPTYPRPSFAPLGRSTVSAQPAGQADIAL